MICILGLLIYCTFSFQLAQAASLEVYVVDVNNHPVNNLPIKLSPEDSDIQIPTHTNPEGKSTFEGLESKGFELILEDLEHD